MWWGRKPPHTADICGMERAHPGPEAAARLLAAAQLGRLGEINVDRVLQSLRSMVWTADKERYGLIKWYLEQEAPVDSNSAFFTGLPLIALRSAHPEKLDASELACLDWILKKLSAWFMRCCGNPSEHYPNKHLGDLVCTWLIIEQSGGEGAEIVAAAMRRAAKYWRGAGGWGWGEHLGLYINIMLDQLSALLLIEQKLPADIRSDYLGLLNELLAFQDLFRGAPPVPALRCYAFTESPGPYNYREFVKRWKAGEHIEFTKRAPFADFFAERGWHNFVAPPSSPAELPATFSVPCFGGKTAYAHVEGNMRVGGMSRFPVMDWAEGEDWGLSWQCFPVSIWRPEGDWGFLIWHAEENGTLRSHPMGESFNPKSPRQLTDNTCPPLVGRTESKMRAGDLVAARFMPFRSSSWKKFGDGFRIIRSNAAAEVERSSGNWMRAVLLWNDRRVSVEFLNLTDDRLPGLRKNDFGGHDLTLDYDMSVKGPALGLWRIRIDGGGDGPPIVEEEDVPPQSRPPGGGAFRVIWGERRLCLDPVGADLLKEEAASAGG